MLFSWLALDYNKIFTAGRVPSRAPHTPLTPPPRRAVLQITYRIARNNRNTMEKIEKLNYFKGNFMAIHLAIDDSLINEACVVGHFKNREDAVINALREFINRRKQQMTLQKSNAVIFGVMEGKFSIPTNFDNPLPQDVEDDFYSAAL